MKMRTLTLAHYLRPKPRLEAAIERLRAEGHAVDRHDFPPPPFPGLYMVNGRGDWTENQIVAMAEDGIP